MSGKDVALALILFGLGLSWVLALRYFWRTARATERTAEELAEHRKIAGRIEEAAKKKEGK